MSTLTGQLQSGSYKDLLQVSNSNSGIDSTLRTISDGEATDSKLQLSTTTVNIVSGFEIGGTAVTSTAAELNLLDGVTAGTAVASLALVVDASKDIDLGTGDLVATLLTGTLQTAAQTNITSLGTLTTLTVDDITINTNAISSGGASSLTITPTAGQKLILDGHWGFDGVAFTAETDANTTFAAYAGKNITIESVTFDNNVVTATTFSGALSGNATTATTLATARTIGGVSFDGSANITVASATGGFAVTGTLSATGKISTIVTTEQFRLGYDVTNYAHFTVDAEGRLTITTVDADAAEGDIVLMPDGYVGIGVAAPGTNLHVLSSVVTGADYSADDPFVVERDADANINIISNPANVGGVLFSDATRASGGLIYDHNTDVFGFRIAGVNDKLTIDSSGNATFAGTIGSGAITITDGLTTTGAVFNLSTKELTVVDGDKLGQINFQAPLESSGTDAILVGASIWAEADDTFAADNNKTSLVFATGASETAAEKMRLNSVGALSIATIGTGDVDFLTLDGSSTTTSRPVFSLKSDRANDGDGLGEIKWFNDGVTPVGQISAFRGSTDLKGDLVFYTSNALAMTIDEDGDATFASDLTVSGTTINMVTSGTTLTVGVGVDNGTVSAGVFSDRTPFYDGDALSEIKKIKGIDGKIDHSTLPDFVSVEITRDVFEKKPKKDENDNNILDENDKIIYENVKVGEETTIERNIGNMISVNVKAFQQLIDEIAYLKIELNKKEDK